MEVISPFSVLRRAQGEGSDCRPFGWLRGSLSSRDRARVVKKTRKQLAGDIKGGKKTKDFDLWALRFAVLEAGLCVSHERE